MPSLYSKLFIIISVCTIFSIPVHAEETDKKKRDAFGSLESYEPNLLGYRYDDNDSGYLDFKISLKYPMFHSGEPERPNWDWFPHIYLAFTGRFSQYINERDSAPVISKRFNPEIFGRYWLDYANKGYLDIAYGHESNGQSINTSAAYIAKRNSFVAAGEQAYYADDYISRGWDYIGATWKFHHKVPFTKSSTFAGYLQLRYFLDDGWLQGKKEEYNSWENHPEGKPRSSVDGIRFKLRFDTDFINNKVFKSNKLFLSFTTGYKDAFKYNTILAEWAVRIKNVPVMFWMARGYNSDLVDYYKKVNSAGIAIEFVSD